MLEMQITIVAPDLAAAINNLAAAMSGNKIETKTEVKAEAEEAKTEETPVKTKKSKTAAAPATAAGNADSGTAPAITAEKISLTDVRAVALKLSKEGKQDLLKAAFAKFGGKKLSDIKEADYAALLAELNSGGVE